MVNLKRILTTDISTKLNQEVHLKGYVDQIRRLGGLTFLSIRDRKGTAQAISEDPNIKVSDIRKYDIISMTGIVKEEAQAPKGYEVVVKGFSVLSSPKEPYPISISPKSNEKLENLLRYRGISIRNPKVRDIFTFQQSISQVFRNCLKSEDFIEIFTPKIVSQVAESGSNMFSLKYFENNAFLTQSPQFYKQILVGSGLERVFEIGHVYRAEDHNTTRHLNEYISMDLEMGFIDSFYDLMDLEENMLRYIFKSIKEKHRGILDEFNVELPSFDSIPRIPFLEMKEILQKKYKKKFEEEKDIDPEGERLACKYVKEKFNSDLVFLTHYPIRNRPFYTYKSREDSSLTDSFDLLLNGIEITTGGQRIHDYDELISSMHEFRLNPSKYEGYLHAFKYGMPPHGGMALGLERVTMQLLGLKNIREATLFPRDRNRLTP